MDSPRPPMVPALPSYGRKPIEYQSWLLTELDAVSLHLAELIADARATAAAGPSRAIAKVGVDWPTLALAAGIYGAFAILTWFYRDLPWWLMRSGCAGRVIRVADGSRPVACG